MERLTAHRALASAMAATLVGRRPIKSASHGDAVVSHPLVQKTRQVTLEKEIAEVLKHKSADDLEIVELKRQKLHLKDTIERLQNGIASGNK